ncbi:MAG TPA: extracellular solute-binding protein [Thermoanaerobaculia bacterium]|jgi:multiple sugar transport system substrate-binding protein|nr:extracellular solute-binding protein [Thermoanaerobaculia bacterium]
MRDKPGRRLSRRQFVKAAGTALAAGALPGLACAPRGGPRAAAKKTLRILQWSHFVPGYDRWFDGVYTKEWGAKNGIEVIVDHMTSTEVAARGAAEAAAKRGHDLFLFNAPPASFESQVIDHREIVEEVERRHGKMITLAEKSTLDPITGKYFAFSDSYVPDPGNYRIDLWSAIGFPEGPDSWEDLRVGGRKIKEKFGNPVGIGFSQETDSNMALRAALWSFGGAEQDEKGNVVLDSKATVEALKFLRALYRETETAEVFTWDPASNNRAILAGRASFVQNAISVTRAAEKDNPAMAKKIGLVPALRGPVRRIAAEHVMNCYVIWAFADNIEGAKQFLFDLIGSFGSVFKESEFYNFPCYPTTVPDLAQQLANDPKADPPGKYKVLSGVLDWATNVGYPGYATAAIDEAFNTFLIPTMFARVARGEATPQDAARAADAELRRIADRRRRG